MEWWQDVVNYEEDYVKGKLFIVNETNLSEGDYFAEMRSKYYKCNYYISSNGKKEIIINPNPNMGLELENKPYPVAYKSFSESEFSIKNYLDVPIKASDLKEYNEHTKILEWTVSQVLDFDKNNIPINYCFY